MDTKRYTGKNANKIDNENESESKDLNKILTIPQITQIKDQFYAAPNQSLEKNLFRKMLWDVAKISYDDEEFELLYLKIDSGIASTSISWYDFLMHLIMGFQCEETEKHSGQLEPPIKEIEKEIKSLHRHGIIKITFVPEISQNKTVSHLNGSYVTCSKDGVINYWSIELEHERTVVSQPYTLKTIATWVTDLVALPDVNVICVSSTERELRFYDSIANKFELRVVISSLEDYACVLDYTFYADVKKKSKLIYGDCVGRVRMIKFIPENRGPFRGTSRKSVVAAPYEEFAKGAIPLMTVKDLPYRHLDYVRQVAYFQVINCIVSIASTSEKSMFVYSTKTKDILYTFNISKGFSCFAMAKNMQIVVTGGRDCYIRLWNPFVTDRATSTLRGHHTEIVCLIVQEDDNILCSMDNERYIKVWDMMEQLCLQTFLGLHSSMNKSVQLCSYYNPVTRQLFIADLRIRTLRIFPLLNGEFTDGVSHSKEVSVVLFNRLLQVIVTCGYDSLIIVWDPFSGRRQKVIRNAHMKTMQGETMPVEITAAAFDPSLKLLISGATDGTLKIWNFNTGVCYRNMNVEEGCEVCSIIWLKYRILVTGENRVVTEFADGEDASYSSFKNWTSRHDDDILCAAANLPQALVTASYKGEIVFWRLETGQPYGMYNVLFPRERIQQQFHVERRRSKPSKISGGRSMWTAPSYKVGLSKLQNAMSDHAQQYRNIKLPIHALLFLITRRVEPTIGTLFVSLENGMIQLWSHHAGGGYLCIFKAKHAPHDYVITMCTDAKNEYLFTGHMGGYVKVWHIINYGQNEVDQVKVCMPLLRLTFPFLWKELIPGRAKRAAQADGPRLLSSFRGHIKPVTGLVYLDENQIIISCSSDKSARLWTLGGRYLGTLGSFKPWTYITPNVPVDKQRTLVLPADIQRTASFSTRKVLLAGSLVDPMAPEEEEEVLDYELLESKNMDFEHVLGHHFKLPKGSTEYPSILGDGHSTQISPYSQVTLYEFDEIRRVETPELLQQIRAQNETVLTKPKKTKVCSFRNKFN